MKIFDLLEQVAVEIGNTNQQQRYLIHNHFERVEWVRAARLWLQGIGSHSRMPSEVLVTLRGIQNYYAEHRTITHKQSLYITHAMLDYWSEISLEIRSLLVSC
jgi:hypothetical protein